jgi:thioredoxin 1
MKRKPEKQMVSELDSRSFNDFVNSRRFVLVDFWAPWCVPCIRFAPEFESLSQLNMEISFAKVNIDECEDLSEMYGINVVPTFCLFIDGHLVDKVEGVKTALL